MPAISTKHLHQIPMIPLTAKLAMSNHDLTHEQAEARMCAALHEAAHLVASIACLGSHIININLPPKKQGPRGVFGTCFSAESQPFEESFVSMAGFAWEELHGDASFAAGDYARAVSEHSEYLEALAMARAFIVSHDSVIRYAATGILCLCTVKGRLDGLRVTALVKWLKPQIDVRTRRGPIGT